MAVIPPKGSVGYPIYLSGAPSAGTDEVQTITFGTGITGGTFKLNFDGQITAAITWTATDATLVSNIDAALEALGNIGTGGVTTAAGTVTSGIGTVTVTFVAAKGKLAVSTMTVANNSLTGTTHVVSVAETTPGVTATGRGYPIGQPYVNSANGKWYTNTGTSLAPTWTVIGAQT